MQNGTVKEISRPDTHTFLAKKAYLVESKYIEHFIQFSGDQLSSSRVNSVTLCCAIQNYKEPKFVLKILPNGL